MNIFKNEWNYSFDQSVIDWLKNGKKLEELQLKIREAFNFTNIISDSEVTGIPLITDQSWVIIYSKNFGPCLKFKITEISKSYL